MTSSSNKVITNGLHNNSSGKILVSITDNVVTPSSSSAATHGSSRKKSAKNKTSLGLLFPSNIKSPSSSSSFAESPPVVPIEVEIATDKIQQPLQTNVPTKAAAQQEPNNIVVQDESLTLGKGEQHLDSVCCLSRDMAIAEMAHNQSSASPSGTKPKSAANEEWGRASVDTEVLGCLKRAQDDEVK
jgi:hypothetical protein